MIYYNLLDSNNKTVLSNLPDDLIEDAKKCNFKSEKIRYKGMQCRYGKLKKDKVGEAFLLTSNIDEVNSSRIFKDKIILFFNFINDIKNIKDEIINNILHDITRTNGYCIQELYELIPGEVARGKTYEEQISLLEKYIISNTKNVAKGIFKINRDVMQLKTECSNLKYLYSKKIQVEKKNHNIGKAIMPSLHVYMPHLNKKSVTVDINEKASKEINLNYEYFESAMIPLLDNIEKYILHNTVLEIYFGDTINGYAVNFDMISMAIKKEEKEKIFEKGYSGINAKRNKINGKGIGIPRIVDSLSINDAELRITINASKKREKRYNETDYERNVFQIVFLNQ